MIVGLDLGSKELFEADPPYSNEELLRSVRRASSLGFKAVQIGPLGNFVPIEGKQLRTVLDGLNVERNVHVGGLYDAEKFVLTRRECARARKEMRYGIMLCRMIRSTLVSLHPPFFASRSLVSEAVQSKARERFFELVEEQVDFAGRNHVSVALESFCYPPFIFEGLDDFARFVSRFPSEKLGVLLDVGHLYQMRIDLSEAVHLFEDRLLDVHVHDATVERDYRKATHLPVGMGSVDFPKLIGLLREVEFDGWLTLEIHGSEKEILESKRYLEGLI